jgi:hypothetical protein
MHTHHQGTGADCLDLFVAKGIVGTRDMGGDADFILPLRERVKSGAVLGPEIVASGPILDDAPPDFPYRRRVRNAAEAKEAVRDLKRLGVDSSRFMTTLRETSSLRSPTRRPKLV